MSGQGLCWTEGENCACGPTFVVSVARIPSPSFSSKNMRFMFAVYRRRGCATAGTRFFVMSASWQGKLKKRKREKMGTVKDITGLRSGRLVATEHVGGDTTKHHKAIWLCLCDCGGTKMVRASNLTKVGGIQSCGCLRVFHGQHATRHKSPAVLNRIAGHFPFRLESTRHAHL
jgi:hypothetical protein